MFMLSARIQLLRSNYVPILQIFETDFDYVLCNKCHDIVDMIFEYTQDWLRNFMTITSYKTILKNNKEKERCHISVILGRLQNTKNGESFVIKTENTTHFDDPVSDNNDRRIDKNWSVFNEYLKTPSYNEVKQEPIDFSTFDEIDETYSFFEDNIKLEIEDMDVMKECSKGIDNFSLDQLQDVDSKGKIFIDIKC